MIQQISITEVIKDGKPLIKILIIAQTQQDIQDELKDENSMLRALLWFCTREGIREMEITIITDDAPKVIRPESITKRCRFLDLTEKEEEIALHNCNGLSRKEIADKLCISDSTLRTHFHHIAGKIGVWTDKQLRHITICTDAEYLLYYYEEIETYRLKTFPDYVKKEFPMNGK